jgi:copper type II ascorbate-dependent monooxygenase-like protein
MRFGDPFSLVALPAACIGASMATGCRSFSRSNVEPPPEAELTFAYDAPAGSEAYECFGFDASPLPGAYITRIDWATPDGGTGAVLHHAGLYAYPDDYPDGPVSCDSMPVAWTMHIWYPGGDSLTLPAGVALALPEGTRRFVVQAHVLRIAGGPAGVATVTLHATTEPPEHVATWLPAAGTVPALGPQQTLTSSFTCVAAARMHIVSTTPHMHELGRAFQGAVTGADGSTAAIVDVPDWSFDEQKTYAVERDVAPGDGIETTCTWTNFTDSVVLPGAASNEEMCAQALIVWPAETAAWTPGPCL